MAVIEGTSELKTAIAEYDFAVDGGVVGSIVGRGSGAHGNIIPAGSVIMGGYVEVDTPVTSGGAGTLAAQLEAANDIVAAAAVSGAPWSTAGRKSVIPAFTGATTVKTTVARSLTWVIGTAALTAGKARVVLFFK